MNTHAYIHVYDVPMYFISNTKSFGITTQITPYANSVKPSAARIKFNIVYLTFYNLGRYKKRQ